MALQRLRHQGQKTHHDINACNHKGRHHRQGNVKEGSIHDYLFVLTSYMPYFHMVAELEATSDHHQDHKGIREVHPRRIRHHKERHINQGRQKWSQHQHWVLPDNVAML